MSFHKLKILSFNFLTSAFDKTLFMALDQEEVQLLFHTCKSLHLESLLQLDPSLRIPDHIFQKIAEFGSTSKFESILSRSIVEFVDLSFHPTRTV